MRDEHTLISGLSVLIAEDNNYMRSLLRTMVAGFGVRNIYEAQDGADAIALVIDRRPDIILLDWIMSPVDGNEFLKILRNDSDPQIAKTPVIVISADARRSVVVQAINAGTHLFLSKPIAPAVLYERMVAIFAAETPLKQAKDAIGGNSSKWNEHINMLEKAVSKGSVSAEDRKRLKKLTGPDEDDQTFL